MRTLAGIMLVALAHCAAAQDRVEIDPNTRIQGGADLRGSGANAGAGAQPDSAQPAQPEGKLETPARVEERGSVAGPDRIDPDKDKPISARKPQEREREDAAQGAGTRPRQ
jgi:hypothetical protein